MAESNHKIQQKPAPEETRWRNRAVPLQDIIVQGDIEKLVSWAEIIGRDLAPDKSQRNDRDKLTTTQIRSFFSEVKQIQSSIHNEETLLPEVKRQLILLKPKLAYQAGRQEQNRNKGVTYLERVLTPAINLIGDSAEAFSNFVDFFEAILAYHKNEGGKEH